ncbi:MAG: acylneuraminate cytidylyltransferase family protein [Pseudomonadota bacterium]
MTGSLSSYAVIPARGGSKGIPGKNLKTVGGVPLVARAVGAARSARVGGVAVSTDDAAIAAAALAAGAEVIERPAALSVDTASSEAALLHALDWLAAAGREPQVLVFLQCTSPFVDAACVDAVLNAVTEGGFDAAFSATPDHGFLWRLGAGGIAEGTNHDHTKPRERRQDRAAQYRENGAVYAMRSTAFRAERTRFCGRVTLVASTMPAVEIDAPEDLAIAEALLASGRPVR